MLNYLEIWQENKNGIANVGHFSHFRMLQQLKFYTECKSLKRFEGGQTKGHSYEIQLKLVQWIGSSCHLQIKVQFTTFVVTPGCYDCVTNQYGLNKLSRGSQK